MTRSRRDFLLTLAGLGTGAAAAEPMAYDREVTLVLDDWATGTGRPVPATNAGTAGGRGSAGGMMSGAARPRSIWRCSSKCV